MRNSRDARVRQRFALGGLVRKSGLSFGGQLARAMLNAGIFVVVARVLGVDGFGSFASSIALVALAAPFANLGAMSVMIRRNARDIENVAVDYSSAVAVTIGCGLMASGIICIVNLSVNPISVASHVLFLVAVGDLVGYRLSELSGAALQARDWIFGTAYFPAFVGLGRLASVLVAYYLADHVSLALVAVAYSIGSVVVAVLVLIGTVSVVGAAWPHPMSFLRQWREGLMYSIGLSAQGVYNDIDKVMLASLSSLGSAGVYAAAYRVIDLAFVPMRAVLSVTYVRFFRLGASGAEKSATLAVSLLKPSLALSGIASLSLLLGANLIPVLLGEGYADTVWIVRLLAVIPLLRTLHYLAADSLTGAGKQGVRTAWQVAMAVSNFAVNLILIPRYGIGGAIVTSILADLGLAVVLWLSVRSVVRRSRASNVDGALRSRS